MTSPSYPQGLNNITNHEIGIDAAGHITVTIGAILRRGHRIPDMTDAQRLLTAALRAVQAEAEAIDRENPRGVLHTQRSDQRK